MFKVNREIVEFSKLIEKFHIKRWDELPEFDLYATQVIDLLKKELFFLREFDEEFITKSMINNYVKNKFIPKPDNKKYSREAMAKLVVITLLKQILGINDVYKGMQLQIEILGSTEKAYNTFCEELERAFHLIFGKVAIGRFPIDLEVKSVEKDSINLTLASMSLASKVLIKKLISSDGFLVTD